MTELFVSSAWSWHFAVTCGAMSEPERREDPHREARALLQRVAEGEVEAFGALYDHFASTLLGVVMTILRNREEAEDVVQDIFLIVWKRAGSYDPALGAPVSWLMAVARNQAYDRYRSLRRKSEARKTKGEELRVRLEAQVSRSWGGAAAADELREIQGALDQLSQDQREAIELIYVEGLTQQEVSEKLEEPLGTIKARVRRGLARLRSLFPGKMRNDKESPD